MSAIEKLWENLENVYEEYKTSAETQATCMNALEYVQTLSISVEEKQKLSNLLNDVSIVSQKQGFMNGFDLAMKFVTGR